jgi:hypothetical protein
MHGRFSRGVLGLALAAGLGLVPVALSAAPASAWFGNQGCTPGYWKNHADAWADTPYSPTDTVGSVFTVPADLSSFSSETLHDALQGGGGKGVTGATTILLRAAVASLLNANDANVLFHSPSTAIVNHVNTALASEKRGKILRLATRLDGFNNGTDGCPLN